MTHHDDLDRDLVAWFSDDATRRAPARLLEAIAIDTRTRPQVPGWLATLRGESMGADARGSTRTRKLTLALVVIALIAIIAAIVASGRPREPHGGLLAFVRGGDVYLAAPDGSDAHLVLRQNGVAFSTVAWSPTGRLALDGDSGAVIFDVQTGRTTLVGGHNPTWSPDGLQLAVLREIPGTDQSPWTFNLRIVDATTLATVSERPFDAIRGLSWSPNGRWIAATGGELSKSVVRIDVSTGEVIQIEGPSGHLDSAKEVTWSPDSNHVAFIRYRPVLQTAPRGQRCSDGLECEVDVIVADADGSNSHPLNQHDRSADQPSWSPDGQWIAFRDVFPNSLGPTGIHLVKADGTGERTLVTAQVAGYAWSPDSQGVLYAVADLPDQAATVSAVSLNGVVRDMGLAVDKGYTPFGSTGLGFDLKALPGGGTATMPTIVAPGANATTGIVAPPFAGPADPSAIWPMLASDQTGGCDPVTISTATGLATVIAHLCDPLLTDQWEGVSSGSWSPSGSAYALVRPSGHGTMALAIARFDGAIVLDVDVREPRAGLVWAPDGSRLGFIVDGDLWIVEGQRAGPWTLHTVPVDGATDVAWSPDGRMLAIEQSDGSLLVGQSDGADLRSIGSYPMPAAWAPDGSRFAFLRDGDVWIGDTAGGDPRNLSKLPLGGAAGASWSSDGNWIAVISGSGLLLVTVDGGNQRWLDLGRDHIDGVTWAPDSARLAASVSGSSQRVLIVSLDGTPTVQVDAVSSPQWSPDGRFLLVDWGAYLAFVNGDGTGRHVFRSAPASLNTTIWLK